MKLTQVNKRFFTTPLEGWNPSTASWDAAVVHGTFQVADRFITERSFGQRKRNFMTEGPMPAAYSLFRLGGQAVYIVESTELDMEDADVMRQVHMIHEMPFACQFIRLKTEKRLSGGSSAPVREVIADTWCDLDRYGQDADQASGPALFPTYNVSFALPILSLISAETILSVAGKDYDLDMVSHNLEAGWARATYRGPSA